VTRPLVLVVEDDSVMRGVITLALRSHGYDTRAAATGTEALREVERRTPDAVILDIGLPDKDGFEVTADIRRRHELPIIVLSARSDEQFQVRALDGGANDYVTKPFREGELMARVRAAMRRPVAVSERRSISVGDLSIDVVTRRVFLGGREVVLTTKEFKLLYALARAGGRVVTHQQLLREVWGSSNVDDVHYLRVYVKQLREKIERAPARPERLLTALGIGYQLVAGDAD